MSKLSVTFYGGVGSVTGANFMLTDGKTKILVDCGLEQGVHGKCDADPNRKAFAYNPAEMDILLVTHAHADHIGRIPKLVRDGFRGQIYSTPQTHQLVEYMFADALNINEHEAKRCEMVPTFERNDVALTMTLWHDVPYHTHMSLNDEFDIYLKDAGHILGSSMIQLTYKPESKKIVFTGDLGNSPTPLIRDVEFFDDADYLIMESVYGDRNHEGKATRKEKLEAFLKKIIERKGTLLIPSFSLEKSQVLLHEMNEMIESGRVPAVPTYFDSPLGIKLTDVYAQNVDCFNEKVQARIKAGDDIFNFPKLIRTPDVKDSQQIYRTEGPKIIIAGAGMSAGGRIMDHEKTYLPEARNAILFIGYQVAGSLGRAILEKNSSVTIDGERIPVNAEVEVINGYSSHMDSDHLVEFVGHTAKTVKKVFVVMGEPKTALFLAQRLRDELGVDAVHPEEGDVVELA